MDKAQALDAFWNGFGLTAYDENTVPDDAALPYITYNVLLGDWDSYTVMLNASLWYRSDKWVDISRKATEISGAIGYGGVLLTTDDGRVWLKRGSPFAQRMSDPDDSIRRILLTVEADYYTMT